MDDSIILKSLSLGGYKSFGATQRLPTFSKINLLIGQNNCGKSNVLKFIHDVLPSINVSQKYKLQSLDIHTPKKHPFIYGFCIDPRKSDEAIRFLRSTFSPADEITVTPLIAVLKDKARRDNTDVAWFEYDQNHDFLSTNWPEAFTKINDSHLYKLWQVFSRQSQGSRGQHWQPETIKKLQYKNLINSAVMIPAIRNVDTSEEFENLYDGQGIIKKLSQLERPNALNQQDKVKFNKINQFLRNVTDNPTASIEIPHERDTILVEMNERTLPLESLGTGIQEVIILAATATTLENTVICMEEPELHLNPILQKKLVRYLKENTSNQYFITTHSAALMDTSDAEIYHVTLIDNESIINRATSDKDKSSVCENLGYHPSDLLLTNSIIWVEGPSDRIYINYWIKAIDPTLIEGIHYSIMFYGGRLASHISANELDESIEGLISLIRLNRKAAIVIDSDYENSRSRPNKTKQRLKKEFSEKGVSWITKGREIENYIKPDKIKKAIESIHPSYSLNSKLGQFDNCLSIKTKGRKSKQASKVKVAEYIVSNFGAELDVLDLKSKMNELIKFIRSANQTM